MRIVKLLPYGWCEGVGYALAQLKKIINRHKNKTIYLVGWLVHNKEVMDELSKSNVKILSDTNTSRLNLLKRISNENSVIVLSAHGSERNVVNYAKNHFEYFYDLTCKHVLHNYQIINQYTNNTQIIFYGKKNHPETIAVQSLGKNILVINDSKQLNKIDNQKQYILINQTTIPQEFVKTLLKQLKHKIKHIKFIPTTCAATQKRHTNILSLKPESTLVIVGDKRSNNTMLLVQLARKRQLKTILIENLSQVKTRAFTHTNTIYLTSGTSTPQKTVNEIYKRLQLI